MRHFDFILAGNVIVDVCKIIDEYPGKLEMANVRSIERAIGGLVSNCVCDLARLDPSLSLCVISGVGDDGDGQFALDKLEKESGACLDYVFHRGVTSVSDVMTVADTGERTFFAYRGAGSALDVDDVPLDELSCGIFHLGYALLLDKLDSPDPEYGTRMARLLHDAKARGYITSMDVVSETGDRYATIVPPSLKYTDLFAVNEMEAEKTTGIQLRGENGVIRANLRAACEKLKAFGVRKWAVIHMPEMACGIDENGEYYEVPTLKLPKGYIQGSVGAGDAFTSALLLCAYRGTNLPEALKAANAVAAHSLSKPGASEAVVPVEQAMKLYDEFPVRDLEG